MVFGCTSVVLRFIFSTAHVGYNNFNNTIMQMKFRPTWRLDYCLGFQSIGAQCVLPSYLCYQSLWNWLCISECFESSLSEMHISSLIIKCITLCLTAPWLYSQYSINYRINLFQLWERTWNNLMIIYFIFRSSQAASRAFLISAQTWTPSMTSQLQRRTLRVQHMKVWTVIQFSGTLTQVLRTHAARPQGSQSCLKVTRTLPASLLDRHGHITRITLLWEASRLRTLRKPGRQKETAPNHINKWYRRPFPIPHHPWVLAICSTYICHALQRIIIVAMQLACSPKVSSWLQV